MADILQTVELVKTCPRPELELTFEDRDGASRSQHRFSEKFANLQFNNEINRNSHSQRDPLEAKAQPQG